MGKLFDTIAAEYDFWNDIISVFMQKRVKNIAIDSLKIFNGARVLDLGTGTGDLGGLILKKYPKCSVIGVDASFKMLEIANKKFPDIKFLKQNAEKLEFNDSSFDFVVSGFLLRNVQNKDAVLLEVYRILKRGGYFMQLDFGEKNFVSAIFNFCIILLSFFMKNGNAYRYLVKSKKQFPSPGELMDLYSAHGFVPVLCKKLVCGAISYQVVQKP